MNRWCALLVVVAVGCSGGPSEPPPEWPGEGRIAGDEGRLWVRVEGDPSASDVLVTVHGGPGLSSDYLQDLDALAESDLCVVRYDQRGCDRSKSGYEDADFDLDAQVDDLLRVCDAVAAGRKVHLLGHSWGGLIASQFAAAHPLRVESLILAATMPPDGASSRDGDLAMAEHIADLKLRGIEIRPLGPWREQLPAYLHDPGSEMPESLRQVRLDLTTYGASMKALGPSYDLRDEVAQIRCRTLIVHGASDPFGEGLGRAMERALHRADVQWFELPRCGHFWQENPGPFYERLLAFLAQ